MRILLYMGSGHMLAEIVKIFRTLPETVVIGATPASRLGGSFTIRGDLDTSKLPVYQRVRNVRDTDIPRIIHLKQSSKSFSGRTQKSLARGSQDVRVSVLRSKPRSRNGSR